MKDFVYTFATSLRHLKRHKIYWFWFGVRAIYVAMGVLMPVVLGMSIDVLAHHPIDTSQLGWLAGIYMAMLLVTPGMEVLTASKSVHIGASIANDFRKGALQLLEKAPLDFFKSKSHGDYIKIIAEAYEAIYHISEDISHRYLSPIGSIAGILISTIILKPFVVVIFLVGSAIWLVNLVIMNKREKASVINYLKHEEAVAGGMMEFLNNFRTIFYLNLFKKQQRQLEAVMERSFNSREWRIKRSMRKWYNHSQLLALITIAIFSYSVLGVFRGSLTVGTMVIILSFSGSLAGQMSVLVDLVEQLTSRIAAFVRYRNEIEAPLRDRPSLSEHKVSDFRTLSVSSLTVVREGRESIRDISFAISAGQKIAVIGNTGGGKSTLLDVILKGFTAYEGEVFINNTNYRGLNDKDLVDIYGIVPQEVQLFRGSLKENIASSRRSPSEKELEQLFEMCQLEQLAQNLSVRREPIYEGAANISGGERQRVGIARALFQKHPFLILDEATASLDPKTEKAVMDAIFRNYPDLTLLHVTHRYSLLDKFDTIFILNEGRLVQSGSYTELRKNSPLFIELYMASHISEF
ncbi:MAG: ATP-binding cassette, subfamily B, bacterial [Parcubacteria group bacterium LiPW_15]|nr:MAG: ATP-binding cassette, subfamily B, bacterial [Parcubacteria group bacterium LiPW_15]